MTIGLINQKSIYAMSGEKNPINEDIQLNNNITQLNDLSKVNDINNNEYGNENNLKIDFKITGQWNGFFNAEIRVKNLGDLVIENWQLSFHFSHEITNIWNAQILSRENDSYLIKNLG